MKQQVLTILAACALCLAACSDDTVDRISDVAKEGVSEMIGVMEKKVDQGNLAIRKCDKAYAQARTKMATLISLRDEAKAGMERTRKQMEEAQAAGKETQYDSYKQQHDFYAGQAEKFDATIRKRAERLKTVTATREQLKVDVGLMRDKIDFLTSMRSALDDEDMEQTLDEAAALVRNMQSKCNRLSAEVEVLTVEDE